MIQHTLQGARPEDLTPFERLVHPLSPQAFLGDVWHKQIATFKAPAYPTPPVVTLDQLMAALFETGLGSTSLDYTHPAHPDTERAKDAFFRVKAQWDCAPSADQLAAEIAGGTLVFNRVELRFPDARAWCQQIFKATGFMVGINAYFGATQGASAFGTHFDNHDVFVLQLAGEKDWHMWEAPEPTNGIDHHTCETPTGEADQIVRMEKGDILYVPKRRWHWPKTVDGGPSVHLTVSLRPPRPMDVLDWVEHILAQRALEDQNLGTACVTTGPLSPDEGLERAIEFLAAELSSPDAKKRAQLHLTMRRMERMFGGKRA